MRELLDAHESFDRNRPEPADTADIVSCEINKHRVFRTLLCILQKFAGEAFVLFLRRPRGRVPAMGTVTFRRSTLTSISGLAPITFVAEIEVVHVGARVDPAQGGIDGKRVAPDLALSRESTA